MIFLLAIWLLFGAGTAAIANSNGRGALGWFMIGLLFGPIGIIAALIAGSGYQCPRCKKSVDKEATICPHCRTEYGNTDRQEEIEPAAQEVHKHELPSSCEDPHKLEPGQQADTESCRQPLR